MTSASRITGAQPGVYDVKFRDDQHRECVIKNIDIKADGIFSIEENKLAGLCPRHVLRGARTGDATPSRIGEALSEP